jgi:hypothetical protein
VWPFAKEKIKRSTISLKKAGLIYDLIEKIWPENDLVYDLTEIDRRLWLGCWVKSSHRLNGISETTIFFSGSGTRASISRSLKAAHIAWGYFVGPIMIVDCR